MAIPRQYMTRQQKAILDSLARQTDSSVTALELAAQLREAGLSVGTATIYRHLDKLARQGLVHKLTGDNGAAWQLCRHREDRGCILLKCEGCGLVEHLDCSQLAGLYLHLAASHDFTVDPHKTVLYGRCRQCQPKE